MNTRLEKFDSGWVALSLALGEVEIDVLIRRLEELKSGELKHFHIRNDDFSLDEGVSDIEISIAGKGEQNNMMIE